MPSASAHQHVGRGVTHDPPPGGCWATKAITAGRAHDCAQRHPVLFQVRLVPAKRDGVKVEVEGVRRASPGCFAHQGRDEAFVHGAVGAVGIVSGVGRLGQDVESCRTVPAPFIGAQIADVTDAAVAQQFRQQARPERRAGREWLPNRASAA